MVIDNLKNMRDYESLHPLFKKAFDYIEQTDLGALELGKVVLIEDELFVNVLQWGPKTKEEAKLETHNEYIDIHVPITNGEVMGYTQRNDLPEAEYDAAVDMLEVPSENRNQRSCGIRIWQSADARNHDDL